MKPGIRMFMTLALVAALGGSPAFAQEQDDFLQRYELAKENLAAAVAALPEAGSVAREELDRAVSALRTLSRETDSTALITAMERIFERAREAIQNQSEVDLAVQAEVLRGGFQRIVYDAALRSAIQGDLDTARGRMAAVASDVGVGDEALAALQDAQRSIAELRYAFEAGVASTVQQRLADARTQASSDLDQAYRTLADAYGDYLLVQDSPRMPGEVNAGFVEAAEALVETRVEDLAASLEALESQFAALQEAARNALEGAPSTTDPAQPSEPSELPPTQTTGQDGVPTAPEGQAAEQAEGEGAAADATGGAAEDAVEQDVRADETTGAEADGLTREEIAAQVATEIAERERAEAVAALVSELERSRVEEGRREALATQILDGGYASLDAVIRDLHADASEATYALERGQPEAARGFVRSFGERYRQFLGPIIATAAPQTDLRTAALTNALITADGLRLQDVATLSAQAGALRTVLAGQSPSIAQEAAVDTVRFWAGIVRLVVIVVVGLLAFIPLYLLNLAFGSGNRNWRLVGVALFLLFVPVMYEALAFVADLVASLTGVDALHAVAQYSMFQSPISQVVWAAITGVAVLFAIGGLYGICVQFGLLGRRRTTRATSTEVRDTVDWDEEF